MAEPSSSMNQKKAEPPTYRDHITEMLTAGKGAITEAAFISHAGHTYAKTSDYPRTPKAEISEIIKEFDKPGTYQTLSIGGTKYNISHVDGKLISGTRPGNVGGILVFRTKEMFLVSLYKSSLEQAVPVVQEAGGQFGRWGR